MCPLVLFLLDRTLQTCFHYTVPLKRNCLPATFAKCTLQVKCTEVVPLELGSELLPPIFQGRDLSLLCTLQEPGFSSSGKLLSEVIFFKTHTKPLHINKQGMQIPYCNFSAALCRLQQTDHLFTESHTLRGTFANICLAYMEKFPNIPNLMHVVFPPTFTSKCSFALFCQYHTSYCLSVWHTIYAVFILFILYFVLVATELLCALPHSILCGYSNKKSTRAF